MAGGTRGPEAKLTTQNSGSGSSCIVGRRGVAILPVGWNLSGAHLGETGCVSHFARRWLVLLYLGPCRVSCWVRGEIVIGGVRQVRMKAGPGRWFPHFTLELFLDGG
jgi:hypothetical protein